MQLLLHRSGAACSYFCTAWEQRATTFEPLGSCTRLHPACGSTLECCMQLTITSSTPPNNPAPVFLCILSHQACTLPLPHSSCVQLTKTPSTVLHQFFHASCTVAHTPPPTLTLHASHNRTASQQQFSSKPQSSCPWRLASLFLCPASLCFYALSHCVYALPHCFYALPHCFYALSHCVSMPCLTVFMPCHTVFLCPASLFLCPASLCSCPASLFLCPVLLCFYALPHCFDALPHCFYALPHCFYALPHSLCLCPALELRAAHKK